MIDEKDTLWNEFTESGSIADYLRYKGIYNCGNSAEYGNSCISGEEPHFCKQEADTVVSEG